MPAQPTQEVVFIAVELGKVLRHCDDKTVCLQTIQQPVFITNGASTWRAVIMITRVVG